MEHRIHPVADYIARCTHNGCRWTCNHPTLKAATDCVATHETTHHQENP